jgi:formylglycine-generating enzyme required for sulfatase activity
MPNRKSYLQFLNDKGFKEQDVVPMMTPERRSKFLWWCLQYLGKGAFNSQESEFIINTLESINENANRLIQKIESELRSELKASGVHLPSNVFAGIFPTAEFNAHAVKRDNGYLILVDNGCLQLIEAAVSIFLSEWEISKKAILLACLIERYCQLDRVPTDDESDDEYTDAYTSESDYLTAIGLINFSEEFTLAHEYGHIINKHFSTQHAAEHELEADLWAVKAVVLRKNFRIDDQEDITILRIGGVLTFLGLAYLVERYNTKNGVINKSFNFSYPPARERILQVWFYFNINNLDDQIFLGRQFLDLVDSCCQVLFKEPLGINFGALELFSGFYPLFNSGSKSDLSEFQLINKMVRAAQKAEISSNEQDYSDDNLISPIQSGWFDEPMPRGMSKATQPNVYIWDTGRGIKIEMLYIPPGEFIQGPDEWKQEETSTIGKIDQGYYISKYPVTWNVYQDFCKSTKRELPQAPDWGIVPNHPVVNVSWNDVKAFSQWAGLSLPSDMEWEKAARGTDGRIYPWGNKTPKEKHFILAGDKKNAFNTTFPIDLNPEEASPYGVEQMTGNVWEWCEDWFDYGNNVNLAGKYRVLRGGSFRQRTELCRTIERHRASSNFKFYDIGFRLVKRIDEIPTEEPLHNILTSVLKKDAVTKPNTDLESNVDSQTAKSLFDAVTKWDSFEVRKILESFPSVVFAQDDNGCTPLHNAAKFPYLEQSLEVARILIEYGADVNACDKDGATPLHYVVVRAQWFGPTFAELLLSHGANGSIPTKSGETPVQAAKRWSNVYGDSILHILSRFGFK